MKILLGAHMPFKAKTYFVGSGKFMEEIGANCGMIFLGPPQSTRRVDPSRHMVDKYKEMYAGKIPLENIIVHGPYIVNPASNEKKEFAKEFLLKELLIAEKHGLTTYLIHPGASLKQDVEESLDNLVETARYLLKNTKSINLLIETMSGKGTEICRNLEQMKYVIEKIDSARIGVCIDTCHLFTSGVDLNKKGELVKELKKYNLLEKVKAFHINDSKHELGTNKDRHANLGQGFIKISALRNIVNDKHFENAIKVLETPWVDGKPIYKKEIEQLKGK